MKHTDATTKPYRIILNPVAGKGNALKLAPVLEGHLERLKVPFELVMTEHPGHAISLAEEACGGMHRGVIAAGGDGTGNEVINGLMAAKAAGRDVPPFGVLSVGRGNDLAHGAAMPADLEDGCALLAEPRYNPMDVGRVIGGDYPEGRYFGNGIGIGFDTIVGLEAAKMTHVHGFLAYVFGALKTLIIFPQSPLLELSMGTETRRQRTPQLSVMNGTRMGGTFFMAPEAVNNDGMFDLCMAADVPRLKLIGIIIKYTKGTQAESPDIWFGRVPELSVRAAEGVLVVHADGETICTDGKELKVECIRHALTAICRKENARTDPS